MPIKFKSFITGGLEDEFIFEFTSDNPDYIIYEVYSCYYLDPKYKNAVKISNYGENRIPDFNDADYAVAFHNINYLDRYFRKTTLIAIFERRYLNVKNADFMRVRNETVNKEIRKKFCAGVISNNYSTDGFRLKFIKELSKYKKVDMGGAVMNNIGWRVKKKKIFFFL